MDSMQKELEMWKEENKDHQIALKREQRFEDMTICTFNMCYLFNMFVTNTVQKKQLNVPIEISILNIGTGHSVRYSTPVRFFQSSDDFAKSYLRFSASFILQHERTPCHNFCVNFGKSTISQDLY